MRDVYLYLWPWAPSAYIGPKSVGGTLLKVDKSAYKPTALRDYSHIVTFIKGLPGTLLHNERVLLQEIAEGDEDAFAKLVVHYGPQLEKAVWQVTGTDLAVKDIVQDVLLQIWLDREKLPTLNDPRTWFFRIAYYRSYAWLRHRGVRERGQEVLLAQHSTYSAGNVTEERTLLSETRRLLAAAIDQLSPRARSIYLMSREEHLRPAEIAERLGLSTQTVKNTLSAALQQLKTNLRQKGILLPAILLLMHY